MSLTVTVNEQESELPSSLWPVTTTVVVPTGKNDPEAGDAVTTPQLPVKVEAGKPTTAPHCPGAFDTVILDGQVSKHAPPQHNRVAAKMETVSIRMPPPVGLVPVSKAVRHLNCAF